MEGGRIVEQGTHEGLLTRRGRYHTMARRQVGRDRELAKAALPTAYD